MIRMLELSCLGFLVRKKEKGTWFRFQLVERSKCGENDLFHSTRTRGHQWYWLMEDLGQKLMEDLGQKHRFFFTQCIISLWNSLVQSVTMVMSLEALKENWTFMEDRSNKYDQSQLQYVSEYQVEGSNKRSEAIVSVFSRMGWKYFHFTDIKLFM